MAGMLLTLKPTVRIAVTVTFLRLRLPAAASRPLPADTILVRLQACTVPFYRYLYWSVGHQYVWWMRNSMSDASLDSVLRDSAVSIWVLYHAGEPAGFFELDVRALPTVNLSYFGLLPHATGRGWGSRLLDAAIEAAGTLGGQTLTVNTCTADHHRALPGYLRAGFEPVRTVREVWDVPTGLGLPIPDHLRL